jgi:hypothetical protein
MANNIRPINPGQSNIVPAGAGGAVVDHFAQVFEIAKPTFDAIERLREARTWLEDRRKNYRTVMIDLDDLEEEDQDEAKARLAVIPDLAVLQDTARLLDDAVCRSAPEPWYHLVLGTMLASMPNANNVALDYVCSITDMLIRDEETREKGCEAGFSPPVFVSAIRQVRREQKFVPSAAEILEACKSQRKRFRQLLELDLAGLIQVRENAEAVLRVDWDKHLRESEIPFLGDDIQEIRQKNHIPDDDSDVPF